MKLKIQNLSNNYFVKKITKQDIPIVLALCKDNPNYYDHMKMQPTIENLTETMTDLPPGKTIDDKYFIGFWKEDTLIAILDLIVEYPNEETGYIGWFMMNKEYQGKDLGSEIVQGILHELKRVGLQTARLGYIKGNGQAESFWIKNGFALTGDESKAEDYTVIVMEKAL